MSDSNLTQEEIDTLLGGADELPLDAPDITGTQVLDKSGLIKETEIGKIVELMNESLDYQTNAFSTIYGQEVNYSNIRAYLKELSELQSDLTGSRLVQIQINYIEGLVGENIFLFTVDDTLRFAELIHSGKHQDINEDVLEALSGGLLQMMAASNTYLGQHLSKIVNISKPKIEILENSSKFRFPSGAKCVHIRFNINPKVGKAIVVNQIISVQLAKEFITVQKRVSSSDIYGQYDTSVRDDASKLRKEAITVRPVMFSQLDLGSHKEEEGKINLLLDINMQLSVELGRTRKRIREILSWGEGSIVDLSTHAGEPANLYVNEKLIAKGEIQVIGGADDNFAIRITEIVSTRPQDRN